MKKMLFVACLGMGLMLTGCATIFSGTKCRVKVTPSGSDQPTAEVYLNGNYEGTAPCKVKVSKKSLQLGAVVEIKSAGYEPQKVTLTRKLKIGAFIGDCLTGFIWLIFDYADGAIYKAYPGKIKYRLQPIATQTTPTTPTK